MLLLTLHTPGPFHLPLQTIELGPLSRLQHLQHLSIKEPLDRRHDRCGMHLELKHPHASALHRLTCLTSLELHGEGVQGRYRAH